MTPPRPVVLVTGAQQGIGAGIARHLAARGYDVALNWFDDAQAARDLVAALEGLGARAFAVQADLSDAEAARDLLGASVAHFGRLDALVNNAAHFPRAEFLEMELDEWDAVMNVNLRAAFVLGQAAARQMVAQGHGGGIVNLASQAVRGVRRSAHYVASKGAILTLTRAMALDLAPHGIRVNAVAPGLIDTAQPRVVHSDEELAQRGAQVPIGRIGQPGDIAAAIAYLLSGEASYVTGETLNVNGGSYMT